MLLSEALWQKNRQQEKGKVVDLLIKRKLISVCDIACWNRPEHEGKK
jgi:hypothetical protein